MTVAVWDGAGSGKLKKTIVKIQRDLASHFFVSIKSSKIVMSAP